VCAGREHCTPLADRETVSEREGEPHLVYEFVDGMKDLSPPLEADLVPASEKRAAPRLVGSGDGV
jgi:hypothetical protein